MPTTVTLAHLKAIHLHLADLLGETDTSRAEVIAQATIGEAPVYPDLTATNLGVVSEGLREASIAVAPLRRQGIVDLFHLVRQGMPMCARCGRFRVQLVGTATWEAVEGPGCPKDGGLFAVETRAEIIGWHNGRSYPDGTTHDPDGVPLTEEAIRADRTVHPTVDAACDETGASLRDVLTTLRYDGASPAGALRAIEVPNGHWPSTLAQRTFTARAKGSFQTRASTPRSTTVGNPGGDGFAPPTTLNRMSVRQLMVRLYDTTARIRVVASDLHMNLGRIVFDGSAETAWASVIDEAEKAGKLAALVEYAHTNNPGNREAAAMAALLR